MCRDAASVAGFIVSLWLLRINREDGSVIPQKL